MKIINIVLGMAVVTSVLQADCVTLLNQELRKADCEELVQCRDTYLFNILDENIKEHDKVLKVYDVNLMVYNDIVSLEEEGKIKQQLDKWLRILSGVMQMVPKTELIERFEGMAHVLIDSNNMQGFVFSETVGFVSSELFDRYSKDLSSIVSTNINIGYQVIELKKDIDKNRGQYNKTLNELRKDIEVQKKKIDNYKKSWKLLKKEILKLNRQKNNIDAFCSSY